MEKFKKYMKKFGQYLAQKLRSRKVQIVIAATVLLCFGKIGEWAWVAIAGTYIGVNLIQKIRGER